MTKKNIRIALAAILVTILVTLLIQNSESVTISFISIHLQMPLFVVVLIAVLFGWILGRLVRWKG